jgi:hypothetical protein
MVPPAVPFSFPFLHARIRWCRAQSRRPELLSRRFPLPFPSLPLNHWSTPRWIRSLVHGEGVSAAPTTRLLAVGDAARMAGRSKRHSEWNGSVVTRADRALSACAPCVPTRALCTFLQYIMARRPVAESTTSTHNQRPGIQGAPLAGA